MAGAGASSLLQYLRKFAMPREAVEGTDGQLLRRFTSAGDEAAFATLVRRHGPMILGVCQRVLHTHQDVEDAFQITFIVLVRKARTISNPDQLANWLYGVAYRSSLKVRANIVKRRAKETQALVNSPRADGLDTGWADVRPVLDEEVNRLPDKYRLPFVLCHLEGKTNEEASRLIGCPKGTVLSRLAWARQRLRTRLARRGVGLSVATLTTLVTENATATVNSALVSRTVEVAMLTAAGVVVPGSLIAERVVVAMLISKFKTAAMFATAIGLTVGLAAGLTQLAVAHQAIAAKIKNEDAPVSDAIAYLKVAVNTDDILEATGLGIYKFHLNVPKGERFQLSMTSYKSKEDRPADLSHWDFTSNQDKAITLRVSFMRLDKRLGNALLSDDKEVEYRISCEGTTHLGYATVIANPLADHREKTLYVPLSNKDWWHNQNPGTTRLVVVADRKSQHNQNMDSAFPRAELTITRLPKQD